MSIKIEIDYACGIEELKSELKAYGIEYVKTSFPGPSPYPVAEICGPQVNLVAYLVGSYHNTPDNLADFKEVKELYPELFTNI